MRDIKLCHAELCKLLLKFSDVLLAHFLYCYFKDKDTLLAGNNTLLAGTKMSRPCVKLWNMLLSNIRKTKTPFSIFQNCGRNSTIQISRRNWKSKNARLVTNTNMYIIIGILELLRDVGTFCRFEMEQFRNGKPTYPVFSKAHREIWS